MRKNIYKGLAYGSCLEGTTVAALCTKDGIIMLPINYSANIVMKNSVPRIMTTYK